MFVSVDNTVDLLCYLVLQLDLERREAEIRAKREEEERKRLEEALLARQEEERKRLAEEELARIKQVRHFNTAIQTTERLSWWHRE